ATCWSLSGRVSLSDSAGAESRWKRSRFGCCRLRDRSWTSSGRYRRKDRTGASIAVGYGAGQEQDMQERICPNRAGRSDRVLLGQSMFGTEDVQNRVLSRGRVSHTAQGREQNVAGC